ncbi:hypothetical protein PHET_08898 [Paragonimus heterotremus]|uniref:Uncharacterized protein n=1 Tax=Paragonimus heterotremus TaxID=100268 RepID=A0A8J4STI0_9TREM|nr:hypothetical protein PHET_08898 [Paragonimus heterotremus]
MNTSFFTQDEKGFPKTNVFDDVSPIATHLKCNKFLGREGGNTKGNLPTPRCTNSYQLKSILNPNPTGDINRTIETLFDVRNQLHELSNILGVAQPVQLKQSEMNSVTPCIRRRSPRLIEKDKSCYLEHLEAEKPTEKIDLKDKPKFKESPVSMLDFLTAQETYLENHQKSLINTTEDLMKIQTDLIEFSKSEMNVNYNTLVREVRDETIKCFKKCLQDKLEIMFCEP